MSSQLAATRTLCSFGAHIAADPAGQGFPGWPVPDVAVETEPGDVIAFDVHLRHCSTGGNARLAWSIEYLPWPGLNDRERLDTVRTLVVDAGDVGDGSYDRSRWPTWREWVAGAGAITSRQIALQRLRLLGALSDEDLQNDPARGDPGTDHRRPLLL